MLEECCGRDVSHLYPCLAFRWDGFPGRLLICCVKIPNPSAEAGITQSKLCTVTSVRLSPRGEAGVRAACLLCVRSFVVDDEGVYMPSET